MAQVKDLVYQVESDILHHSRITKLSYRKDYEYFTGRAGLVRILNLLISAVAIGLMFCGYYPEKLKPDDDLIRMMVSPHFTGYGKSKYTLVSIILGGCAGFISLSSIILLFCFMEVRCDLLWERINQKAHVLACILSVAAAFCDVASLQETQVTNCKTNRCNEEAHHTKVTEYDEAFYPPYFFSHYAAFVLFLSNAMLYSIASRLWLRNED